MDRDEQRAENRQAHVVYANTTCFFLEAGPQSCKIGNKTTLEKAQEWAQKIDPTQNLQKQCSALHSRVWEEVASEKGQNFIT